MPVGNPGAKAAKQWPLYTIVSYTPPTKEEEKAKLAPYYLCEKIQFFISQKVTKNK